MSRSPGTGTAPETPTEERRLALVVAVTDYADPSLRRLRAPAGDAADLRDLLADPEVGGFSVTSVINEKAQQLRLAIEDFLSDRRPDDLLLVYLSCHGLMDPRRRLYFAARDTIKNRLASSGVESHWLLDQLEDCRARRQIVILDCCFSGAFARGAKGDDDIGLRERLVGEGRGRVVLTASRSSEYSLEGEPLAGEDGARGSVFTSALIEGIRTGRADTDNDGNISVDDAYSYAFEQVRGTGHQTPQRWLYGAEGSIILARTPPPAAGSTESDPSPASTSPLQPEVARSAAARHDTRFVARPKRRAVLLAVLGVVALGVAGLVGVLLAPDGTDPGSTLDDGSDGTRAVSNTFTAEAPWRLLIEDATFADGGGDIGCDVTLTNDAAGYRRTWNRFYGVATFQMQMSGSFHYQTNDRGCLVLPQNGSGATSLPFAWSSGDGDTSVFQSPGSISVTVDDWAGSSTCALRLSSADDGRVVDSKEAVEGEGAVRLTSNGSARVYVQDSACSIHVRAVK
jgi:hypothetical protein